MYKTQYKNINTSYNFFNFKERRVQQAHICLKYMASIIQINKKSRNNINCYLRNQRKIFLSNFPNRSIKYIEVLLNQQENLDSQAQYKINEIFLKIQHYSDEQVMDLILDSISEDAQVQFLYMVDIVQLLYQTYGDGDGDQKQSANWILNLTLNNTQFEQIQQIIQCQTKSKKRFQSYVQSGINKKTGKKSDMSDLIDLSYQSGNDNLNGSDNSNESGNDQAKQEFYNLTVENRVLRNQNKSLLQEMKDLIQENQELKQKHIQYQIDQEKKIYELGLLQMQDIQKLQSIDSLIKNREEFWIEQLVLKDFEMLELKQYNQMDHDIYLDFTKYIDSNAKEMKVLNFRQIGQQVERDFKTMKFYRIIIEIYAKLIIQNEYQELEQQRKKGL